MQRFWHIPVYPRPRRITGTSLPVWDEGDPNERVMIHDEETLRGLVPAWAFSLFSLVAFVLLVVIFGYAFT